MEDQDSFHHVKGLRKGVHLWPENLPGRHHEQGIYLNRITEHKLLLRLQWHSSNGVFQRIIPYYFPFHMCKHSIKICMFLYAAGIERVSSWNQVKKAITLLWLCNMDNKFLVYIPIHTFVKKADWSYRIQKLNFA